jgi:reactive chlorine resistance protein C
MTESRAATPPKVLGIFDIARIRTLERLGLVVLRYGMVALLLLWGIFKFAAFEAEAIQPLVGNSPLLRWLYPLLGIRGTPALIGVVEIVAAVLVITRTWKPGLSAIGSLVAASAFLVTLSFLITTPGALSATNPFSGFLLKDIMLLGAALYTAAEALQAAQQG